MGLFSSKCGKCGSTEHTTNECPHGILSSKCGKCGSTEHSTNDCPHGILSSKCGKCGSTEHSTNDCPHGIFSSKCGKCGSTEHSTNDCPHGLFATRKNTSSSDDGGVSLIVYGVLFMIALAIVLYIAMIALFLSPLGLLIWYLIKKRKTQWIAIVGMLISAYLIYDISSGGLITENLMHMRKDGSEKYVTLGYFVVLITTLGFFIDKYSSTKIPVIENRNFFTQKDVKKRRPLIAGFGLLLIALYSVFSFIDFSNSNSYSPPKNNTIQNTNKANNPSTTNQNNATITNNNSNEKPIQNSNTNNNTKRGYVNGTNVIIRENHTTKSKIIGSFKKSGEKLIILDKYLVNNSSETLIKNNVSVRANGRTFNLIKGKAVSINSLNGNTAKITFKDKNLNRISTTITTNYLENINNSVWYKIKRNSGEIGWVFGKFIVEN